MSEYEMLLLGGSGMIVFAVVMFFSAGATDKPLAKSLIIFFLGGITLFFADAASFDGINPGDIGGAFAKMIKMFF